MESLDERLDRTLALAGVIQAATLVKQLACKGSINQDELTTCINSIFETDPASTLAVYGGSPKNLITGLQSLITLFTEGKQPKDQEIARYTISMLHLERQLIKKSNMMNIIQRGVERAKTQAYHFSATHDNVIANLASVYTDTISTFKFRIHVSGENTYLSNPNIINKIRSILLAGIRSAVLWRQLGGSRWQLVFGKRTMLQDAKMLLERAKQHEFAPSE
jgi:high frequency lysogenization protein